LTKAIVAKAHIDRITYKQVYGHITAALGSHDMAEDRLRDGLKKNLRELAAKYRAIP